jgi:hypothetical protein
MSTEFSVFYDLQNLKNKMYFHQVLMQFLQVYILICYWWSINKCYLILTKGLKRAHIPNGLCWVLSVVFRPVLSINSHFYCSPTVMYVCVGGGEFRWHTIENSQYNPFKNKTTHQNWMKNKNSIYLSNMQNILDLSPF